MKIEQCQKRDIKSESPDNKTRDPKTNTDTDKKLSDKEKNNTSRVLQKGAKFIDSYHNIIRKPPNHFGDADTYFRKTLRSYEDFEFWKKCQPDLALNEKVLVEKQAESECQEASKERTSICNFQSNSKLIPTTLANSKLLPEESSSMNYSENDESDYTAAEDDDDEMKEVDDMIVKASKELEQVAEENQHLLEILDAPASSLLDSVGRKPAQEDGSGENQSGVDANVIKQLEETEQQAKDTANIIFELKTRVGELLRREELTEEETRELDRKNKKLKEEMILFEERTKKIQYLIEKTNFITKRKSKEKSADNLTQNSAFETSEENITKSQVRNAGDSIKCSACTCSENLRQTVSTVPAFAKKLCQSYTMQEKLAAENADLESVRFKLQEELLKKDQTLECLQREIETLQNEMKILSRENNSLNEKVNKFHKNEAKENYKQQQRAVGNSLTSTKLQDYSDHAYQLEKQLTDMENDVKCLHEEIYAVKNEREHLEKHRKMMCMNRPCITPHFNIPKPISLSPLSQISTVAKGYSGQFIHDLDDSYDKLENDLKLKISGVVTLQNDIGKLKNLTKEAEDIKVITENKLKDCEKILHSLKSEKKVTAEHEQQLLSAKERFRIAQETLKEEQALVKEQKKLLGEIGNRYLEAQQQLEEQKPQQNSKVEVSGFTGLNLGAQIVTTLQEKLEEMII